MSNRLSVAFILFFLMLSPFSHAAPSSIQESKSPIMKSTLSPAQQTKADLHSGFLGVITNPTVVYLLILLGIYGIFLELITPGIYLPGVIGTISMVLALYALQLLPVNYLGLGFMMLGVAFIIAEGFTPTFGALGAGGTVVFVLGSIMLINSGQPAYQIAWSVIGAMAVVNIIIFIGFLHLALKSRQQPIKNGLATLIGATGRTLDAINLEGQAVIRGEIWNVHAKSLIRADKNIKVIKTEGLLLEVEEDHSSDPLF